MMITASGATVYIQHTDKNRVEQSLQVIRDDIYFVVLYMMTSSNKKHFPRYWPLVRDIHRSPVNAPHKGQWRGALMFSLIWVWINGWINNGDWWFETLSHPLWRHCNVPRINPHPVVSSELHGPAPGLGSLGPWFYSVLHFFGIVKR